MMQWIKEKWLLLLVPCVIAMALFFAIYHPYSGPDFIEDPVQSQLSEPEQISFEGRDGPVKINFLAAYQIIAAVKSRQDYAADFPAQVSPTDLALAWGNLNQDDIASHIRYSQSNRWYYFRYDAESSVTKAYIQEHSANVHIIPADDHVAAIMRQIRTNDTVELNGYLVEVIFASGLWRSSLSRRDAGDGSCEVMYVTAINLE
jgi:hypothetical protein